MNPYAKTVISLGKQFLEDELRNLSKKEASKDADNTGADDARARAYKGFADVIDKIDLDNFKSAKSIKSLGKYFEAFGKALQEEAQNIEEGS